VTLAAAIEQATAAMDSSGLANPGWQALVIAAHVIGRSTSLIHLRKELPFEEKLLQDRFFALVEKRISGVPLQHVIGEWDFYGRTFKVDGRALIPRPETELLIDCITSSVLPEKPSILDVGTGSGVIGISLALEIAGSTVVGTDISPEALELAEENQLLLGAWNYSTELCHLAESLQRQFDVITANLPYIPSKDIPGLPPEVRNYDPLKALDGGIDGTALILELVRCAPDLLNSGGLIVLETGHDQEESVSSFFSDEVWHSIQTKRDLAGNHRIVTARRI
jgi:release factor glutamine methyltransferase